MRIGVVSDSHGDLYMLDKAIVKMGSIDVLVHLGDHYKDILKVNSKYNFELYYVPGNNDYFANGNSEKLIELGNKRIFLTHGHKYNVNYGLMSLVYRGEEQKADIVLYGHTHKYYSDYCNNIFLLNPGSVSKPRDKSPSAAILNIDEKGNVYAEKMQLIY